MYLSFKHRQCKIKHEFSLAKHKKAYIRICNCCIKENYTVQHICTIYIPIKKLNYVQREFIFTHLCVSADVNHCNLLCKLINSILYINNR